MVYAELGGQKECIMGNWKIENNVILAWSGVTKSGKLKNPSFLG